MDNKVTATECRSATPIDLPDRLTLPLATGAPYWYWIGGSPSLDLVNTLRERWHRRVECLVDPADLVAWLRCADLVPEGRHPATTGQLTDARHLREAIDALVVSAVAAAAPPSEAVGVIDDMARRFGPRIGLVVADGVPLALSLGPENAVSAALGVVAQDAVALLGGPQRDRVRICAAADCSARFLDRSRPGRRRWCTMAGCGNRSKVRRLRERRAADQSRDSA